MSDFVLELFPEKIDEILRNATHDSASRAAEVTVRRAQDNLSTGGHNVSGDLYRSIQAVVEESSAGETSIVVGSDEKHAGIVEGGRGPIEAKPGKFLVFKPKGSMKVVFAKRVGPAEAVRYLGRALKALRASDFT